MNGDATAQASARGALASLIGPAQVRGVSMTPDQETVYFVLCRQERCVVHVAGTGDRSRPLLEAADWDYRWVSAEGDAGSVLAVRDRPGADRNPNPVSEIVRYRRGDAAPTVLRAEEGRITSLQSLSGGAYAFFVSTGLRPVDGCRGDCRYTPVAQKLVVVAADGAVVGTMENVVDGLEGEAFWPWGRDEWLVMPWNVSRERQLFALIAGGETPTLRRYETAGDVVAAEGASHGLDALSLSRFNMIADPFRSLGGAPQPVNVDFPVPGTGILIEPDAGRDPHRVQLRTVRREADGTWRRQDERMIEF